MIHREDSLLMYFKDHNDNLSYCCDIKGLIEGWFEIAYDPEEYRLFIDSGKGSFKMVLLNNENKIKPIPLLYSKDLKERESDVEKAMELIMYIEHQWRIVCDFKMIAVLLGLKSGWVLKPCYLCHWVATKKDEQYVKRKKYAKRVSFVIGRSQIRPVFVFLV